MQGLSQFVEAANSPQQYAQRWFQNMATGFVPYSGALRAARNIDDPVLRDVKSIVDSVKNTVPGYSLSLPEKLNIFGETRRITQGSLIGSMSPIPDVTQSQDPALREIVQLQNITQKVPITMPNRRIEGMLLNSKEYHEYTKLSRTEKIFGNGDQDLKEALTDLVLDPSYQELTPEMRVEMMRSYQTKADQVARALMEERDPVYAARIATYRAKKNQVRFGQEE
jgi:hypothetical protein